MICHQHIYFGKVWNLIQALNAQSSDEKLYISTLPSPKVRNKISDLAGYRTSDQLNKKQTWHRLSQCGEHGVRSNSIHLFYNIIFYSTSLFLFSYTSSRRNKLSLYSFHVMTANYITAEDMQFIYLKKKPHFSCRSITYVCLRDFTTDVSNQSTLAPVPEGRTSSHIQPYINISIQYAGIPFTGS